MIITQKQLDETDKKILKLAGEGLTVKEISGKENINVHTISVRIREMKKYFACSNITELVLKTKEQVG